MPLRTRPSGVELLKVTDPASSTPVEVDSHMSASAAGSGAPAHELGSDLGSAEFALQAARWGAPLRRR